MGAGKVLYIVWSLAVILMAYVLPYTVFSLVTDLSLYLFWAVLAVIHLIVSYAYIRLSNSGGRHG